MAKDYKRGLVKDWVKDSVSLCILRNEHMGHFCGYATFSMRPTIEQGYDGILTYVPVHGGITYARRDEDGTFTYGFDCSHCNDEEDPRCRDLDWLTRETEKFVIAIPVAVAYESRYLAAEDSKAKAQVIDQMHEELERDHEIRFDVKDNFGATLKLLSGRL